MLVLIYFLYKKMADNYKNLKNPIEYSMAKIDNDYKETNVQNPIYNAKLNFNSNNSQEPYASGGQGQEQKNIQLIGMSVNSNNNNNQMIMNNLNQIQNYNNQNFQNNFINNNNMQNNNFNNYPQQINQNLINEIIAPYELRIRELEEKLRQKEREIVNLNIQLMSQNHGY